MTFVNSLLDRLAHTWLDRALGDRVLVSAAEVAALDARLAQIETQIAATHDELALLEDVVDTAVGASAAAGLGALDLDEAQIDRLERTVDELTHRADEIGRESAEAAARAEQARVHAQRVQQDLAFLLDALEPDP